MRKIISFVSILSIVASTFIFSSNANAAISRTFIKIDKKTIVKGYTVRHDNDKIRFAVTPNQVDQEVTVELKKRELEHKIPKDKNLVSGVYSFDMLGVEYNPIIVSRPSWLGLKYKSDNDRTKAIYYWDSNRKSWVELPTSLDTENKYARAITHLPYSIVVVLEDKAPTDTYEGIASWYDTGKLMTAAMNQFEMGDKVKVTDVNNGKSVVVTIIDRGPYVIGRVIDLSTDAFEVLAPLSQGLTTVKVTKQ